MIVCRRRQVNFSLKGKADVNARVLEVLAGLLEARGASASRDASLFTVTAEVVMPANSSPVSSPDNVDAPLPCKGKQLPLQQPDAKRHKHLTNDKTNTFTATDRPIHDGNASGIPRHCVPGPVHLPDSTMSVALGTIATREPQDQETTRVVQHKAYQLRMRVQQEAVGQLAVLASVKADSSDEVARHMAALVADIAMDAEQLLSS